jgi:chemotaxis family two-component system response regulator PixG
MVMANDSSNNSEYIDSVEDMIAGGRAVFFEILKRPGYSGRVVLTDARQTKWTFYLYLGTIVYAEGGVHPVRRWRRNLAKYFPSFPPNLSSVWSNFDPVALTGFRGCWEYYLICLWVEQQRISLKQAEEMIHGTIVEVLFDIMQTMQINCQVKPEPPFPTQLILNNIDRTVNEAKQLWWAWQNARIADRFPDHVPIIVQPEELQKQTSPGIYQTLVQLLDGEQTLRDLGVRTERDVLAVTRSLSPYIQSGFIRLVEIADLPCPLPDYASSLSEGVGINNKPLIACIDDSPLICESMKKLLTQAGYDFVGISDPLRALAIILSRKPDFIFLDLVMPNANGYEICGQLRKMSLFRKVPIVILTGNDGIIDRVRAKIVGSSDFINKPVYSETVLEVIRKHLKETAVT